MSAPVSLSSPLEIVPPLVLEKAAPAVPRTLEDLGDDLSVWCEHLINPDGTENLEMAQGYVDTGIALERFLWGRYYSSIDYDRLAYPHGPTLFWAVENGYLEIAKIFLKVKVFVYGTLIFKQDMCLHDQWFTLLTGPNWYNNLPELGGNKVVVREKRAGFLIPPLSFEQTTLGVAVKRRDIEMATLLVQHGHDLYLNKLLKEVNSAFAIELYPHIKDKLTPGEKAAFACFFMYHDNFPYFKEVLEEFPEIRNLCLCYAAQLENINYLKEITRDCDIHSRLHNSIFFGEERSKGAYYRSGSSLEVALKRGRFENARHILSCGFNLSCQYRRRDERDKVKSFIYHLLDNGYSCAFTTAKERLEAIKEYFTDEALTLALSDLLKNYLTANMEYSLINQLLAYYQHCHPSFKLKGLESYRYSCEDLNLLPLLSQKTHADFSSTPAYEEFLERLGFTSLFKAARDNAIAHIQSLIAEGVDTNVYLKTKSKRINPLAIAAYEGHTEVVAVLKEAGAAVEYPPHHFDPHRKISCLEAACMGGHAETLSFLLDDEMVKKCADKSCDYLENLFKIASRFQNVDCIKVLAESFDLQDRVRWYYVQDKESAAFLLSQGLQPKYFSDLIRYTPDSVLLLIFNHLLLSGEFINDRSFVERAIEYRKPLTALALLAHGGFAVDKALLKNAIREGFEDVVAVIRKQLLALEPIKV